MDIFINKHTEWVLNQDGNIKLFLDELGELMEKHKIHSIYQNIEAGKNSIAKITLSSENSLYVNNMVIR